MKKVKSAKTKKNVAKKAKVTAIAKKTKKISYGKKTVKVAKSVKPAKKNTPKKVVKKPVKKNAVPKEKQKSKLVKSPAKAVNKTVSLSKRAVKTTKPLKTAKEKKVTAVKPEKKAKAAIKQPKKTTVKTEKASKIKAVKEKSATRKAAKGDFDDDIFTDEPSTSSGKKRKGGRKPKSMQDDEPGIVNDEMIEQIIQSTKKPSKAPKKPLIKQIFVNPMQSLASALTEGQKKNATNKKEPKGKFELEYVVRTSASILYELLTTPSGLSEWFADDVNIRDGIFTFFWDGSDQKAKLLGYKDEKYVRFQWLDKPEGSYFEFRIEKDELTGDISLIIVDFADEGSDHHTSKLLWDSQVNKLLNVLGSN